MQALVITLRGHPYSEQCADRCIESAKKYGIKVEKWYGIDKEHAEKIMFSQGLQWTWALGNTKEYICPKTGLKQFPYTAKDLRTKIGCSMSHYMLWKECIDFDETFLILEHDAVFINELPDIKFEGICQINDPRGCTRRGAQWSDQMISRGEGIFEKTWVTTPKERNIPDGLAGNSAYLIKPWAAKQLVDMVNKVGVWPNDAIMCKQLFPYLQEYYPFVTKVIQTQSTSIG